MTAQIREPSGRNGAKEKMNRPRVIKLIENVEYINASLTDHPFRSPVALR